MQLVVSLSISAEEYLRLYQGTAKVVVARAENGQRIQFPAAILQRFVTHIGINGRFCIEFDGQNKFKSITQLS